MVTVLRCCLAQINPLVGDLHGNTEKIISCIKQAHNNNADIVIFPELSLSGYPPEDLLYSSSFLNNHAKYLKKIINSTSSMCAVVGYPYTRKGEVFNAAGFMYNKKLTFVYKKMHLPNFAVFDEKRYFEPGNEYSVITLSKKVTIGINICRDIWENNGPHITQTMICGADIIINISSSPFYSQKNKERSRLVRLCARKTKAYYLYCNMVGGQDELVFDGGSFAVDPSGRIIARAKQFEEDMLYVDIPLKRTKINKKIPKRSSHRIKIYEQKIEFKNEQYVTNNRIELFQGKEEELYAALVLGLKDYVRKNNFKKAALGLSGGIDSALTAVIAADALGPHNVTGISMPSLYTSVGTRTDARRMADNIHICFKEISIQPIFRRYLSTLKNSFKGSQAGIAEENIQARIRGNILMAFSNKYGWLVITTGNKSEVSVGYCTLYGDTAGGFAILKDVPKTVVYALAEYRNKKTKKPVIPVSIIKRPPSAELKHNQKDQDTLPPYNVLDAVLDQYITKGFDADRINIPGISKRRIRDIIDRVDKNEYKRRQSPVGIKISPRAFGKDRRMPITFKKSY